MTPTLSLIPANDRSRRNSPGLLFQICILLLLPLVACAGDFRRSWINLKTEPNLDYQIFNITTQPSNPAQLAPGYLFLDVIKGNRGFGTQVFDMQGNPIYLGPRYNRTQNAHPCDFQGQVGAHLCVFRRRFKRMLPKSFGLPAPFEQSYGENVVLDENYNEVWTFNGGPESLPVNGHAFQMMDGGDSFLSPELRIAIHDLSAHGGPKEGWVRDGCINERHTRTKQSVLEWCYLKSGQPLWETQTFYQDYDESNPPKHLSYHKFGAGTKARPFDFLHINSNDKTEQGDYYVSLRHLDQIIKIAGLENPTAPPGTVLWRLGGRSNDFTYQGFLQEIPFSRQHDVRALSVNGSEETLSLFNNAWDGAFDPSQNYSEGLIIKVNTDTMTATLERNYPHPHGLLASGRGSIQLLPNSNVLVGYGIVPDFTEFDYNGTVLYHARFARGGNNTRFSYRVVKGPWKGTPHWSPKLVAYCRQCGSPFRRTDPLVAYASWNGATEVARWRFYTSSNHNGPWDPAGTFPKTSFETQANLIQTTRIPRVFRAYVRAEALDAEGAVLSSVTSKTFVPHPHIASKCNKTECNINDFDYGPEHSLVWPCQVLNNLPLAGIVTASLLIESLNFIVQNMILMRRFWI